MRDGGYTRGFEIDRDHSLHLYQGSLAHVQADALVSSDDNFLSHSTGVSRALAAAAGFDVDRERQEVARKRNLTLGDVVRTSGGGLHCRYLYHAITVDHDLRARMDEAVLRKLIDELLRQATADQVRSIGMPALGTGGAGFDLVRASEVIVDELLVRLVETPIQRVVIALIGDEAEYLFYERLVRSAAHRLASRELRHREGGGGPARPPTSSSPPEPPARDVPQVAPTPQETLQQKLVRIRPHRGSSQVCPRCNAPINEDLTRCPECGADLDSCRTIPPARPKPRPRAAVDPPLPYPPAQDPGGAGAAQDPPGGLRGWMIKLLGGAPPPQPPAPGYQPASPMPPGTPPLGDREGAATPTSPYYGTIADIGDGKTRFIGGIDIDQLKIPQDTFTLQILDNHGRWRAWGPIHANGLNVGRAKNSAEFPGLSSMAVRHMKFRYEKSGLEVEDLGSINGVYLRVTKPVELIDGMRFRVGNQTLEYHSVEPFEPVAPIVGEDGEEYCSQDLGPLAFLDMIRPNGQPGLRFPITRPDATIIGREGPNAHFALSSDNSVSSAHARIVRVDGKFFLEDMKSRNGTFVRILGATLVGPGDIILAGLVLFRVVASGAVDHRHDASPVDHHAADHQPAAPAPIAATDSSALSEHAALPGVRVRGSSTGGHGRSGGQPVRPAEESAGAGEVIEQIPSLIDPERLSSTPPDRPRLVDGLAELVLKHADAEDVERELLSSPACRNFRGTLKQRVMEFLYLSEENLQLALGPALFRNKDLRQMIQELGEDSELPRDQGELVVTILRALCFNTLAPPAGIARYIARLERLLGDLRSGTPDTRALAVAALEAGKILEQALKDLLRMYGYLFFGSDFESELMARQIIARRSDGDPITRLTIGQALEALERSSALMKREASLQAQWRSLGRPVDGLLPRRIDAGPEATGVDGITILRQIIAARNNAAHVSDEGGPAEPEELVPRLQALHAFLCTCQATGVYPDVLRYEGTYENRSGERFVYFLDEHGRERKVRTDDRIDPRRHYYCFATNNPIHIHPTLIPKRY